MKGKIIGNKNLEKITHDLLVLDCILIYKIYGYLLEYFPMFDGLSLLQIKDVCII